MNATDPEADIINRVLNISHRLTLKASVNYKKQTFTFDDFSGEIVYGLNTPAGFPNLTQYLLNAEAATAHLDTQTKRSIMNETFANMPTDDPLAGTWNAFVIEDRMCYDNSFAGIDTPATFVDYISNQIATLDPIVAYMGLSSSSCLTWPNLTSSNVEKFTGPFPNALKNKILVVGVTNSALNSYNASMSTFQYIGENNAVFISHEGFGMGTIDNPNNCTIGILKDYLITGITKEVKIALSLGTLPETGTNCPMEETVEEAWGFQFESMSDPGSRAPKPGPGSGLGPGLGLGLGLGLGVPVLIASIAGFCIVQKRGKQQMIEIIELERGKRAAFT